VSPQDCLFCKIVSKEIPADIVIDRGQIVAFRDINPAAPKHILIIPREHIADGSELTGDHGALLAEIFSAAKELAVSEGIASSGYRVVTNTGRDAGQSVYHVHFHLLGGRRLGWPPG
jgi:histidine triad (HIT) family protein